MGVLGGGKAMWTNDVRVLGFCYCRRGRAKTRQMSTTHPNTTQIDVSNEAKLRWLQRADPNEPNPADRIRELLRRATRTDERVTNAAGWRVGDLIIVTDTDAGIVQTVLRDYESATEER